MQTPRKKEEKQREIVEESFDFREMGLGTLFSFKRSKPKAEVLEKKSDAPRSTRETEGSAKIADANVVYPFHDEKSTSFPPPLSIDASVFTDPHNLPATNYVSERKMLSEKHDKSVKQASRTDVTEGKDKVEDDKGTRSLENDECDWKTCTREKCELESRGNEIDRSSKQQDTVIKRQRDSADKINHDRLTEMINNSMKEAMQIIVKQCRMVSKMQVSARQLKILNVARKHDVERDREKKPKEEHDKSVCRSRGKHELANRSRSPRNGLKSNRQQERRNNVARPKRLHEGNGRSNDKKVNVKKENVIEEVRSKKHSKSTNNARTDNRRMTGNVNIYICSEATETTQATSKPKESRPVADSSSETATDRSNVSSGKLVTCIRNKRRKSKEKHSLDILATREESSDESNTFSCVSKRTDSNVATELESNELIDACNALGKEILAKDTESTLIECKCKDGIVSDPSIDGSDLSSERSKFVVCDETEKPCSTIYPLKVFSRSDSDEWSSRSICSGRNDKYVSLDRERAIDGEQMVSCDRNRSDASSIEDRFERNGYHAGNSREDHGYDEDDRRKTFSKRNFVNACKCRRRNRESMEDVRCDRRSKKRSWKTTEKENLMRPLSSCTCIAEEEEAEDGVCVDGKAREEFTVCKVSVEQMREAATVCRNVSESLKNGTERFATCKNVPSYSKESAIGLKDEYLETVKSTEKDAKETKPKVETDKEEYDKKDSETKEIERPKGKEMEQPKGKEKMPTSRFASPKLIRPEALVLKNILKQQAKPTVQANVTANPGGRMNPGENNSTDRSTKDTVDPGNGAKGEPAFLKKFNLPERHKFSRQAATEPGQDLARKAAEVKAEGKASVGKENQKDKGTKRTFQERLRGSFLYKSLRKVLDKTESPEKKSEVVVEEGEIVEPASNDISTDKRPDTTDTKTDKDRPPTDPKADTKEPQKGKDKFLVPKTDMHKMMRTKGSKPESSTAASEKTATDDKDGKAGGDDSSAKPLESTRKEEKKDVKEDTIVDVAKEKQYKSKLVTMMASEKPSLPSTKDTDDEATKRTKLQKPSKTVESKEIPKEIELQDSTLETEVRKKTDDREKSYPESKKCVTRDEKPRRRIEVDGDSDVDKESDTTRARARRRLPGKESKQSTISQCTLIREPDSRTTCVNSKFIRCTEANESFVNERYEGSRCDCCCLPVSECVDELTNYPKSCLKKDRQFRCVDSQENDASIPFRDGRNWGECGCRRIILCDGCRRSRNECSCRLATACLNCCKSRSKCNCTCKSSFYESRNAYGHARSMFCLYCDNPREKCSCRAPPRKCSRCGLSADLCSCNDVKTICEGRPVLTEPDNDRTMYVTAWRPREEVRRYFSRNLDDLRRDSVNECHCCEKLKPHNSDDLPYQRLSVFSDVMDELQQKMSESTCCTRCRKVPCCCGVKVDDGRDERKIKYCVSPKSRRKIVAVCMEKPKVKSSNNCKCEIGQGNKNDRQKKMIVSVCCACKTTPCRCKKSKSSQKKPKAKCYYCKSSPCVCIATRERSKPRPCRCTDSPCRGKEKESAPYGKTSTKPKNNDGMIICAR